MPRPPYFSRSHRIRRRRVEGFLAWRLGLALGMMLPLPMLVGFLLPNFGRDASQSGPLSCLLERRTFVHEVTVRGEVESAINVEVCCEVKSRLSSWTRILEVIPEGTLVEPGDFLVRLDSSALEDDRLLQQILCDRLNASTITARHALALAQIEQEEYLNGQYILQRQKHETAILNAREKERTSRRYFERSRQLAARGYLNKSQLEADRFALASAENQLRSATTAFSVLESLTLPKRQLQLKNKIVSAKARLEAKEKTLELHRERLALIDEQIEKCILRAPVSGKVVLGHMHHHGHSHYIEPGELTRENRTLIRLPDPDRMQVKTLISEGKVTSILPGMSATIRFDALEGVVLPGVVERVNDYPEPDSFYSSSVKQYETIIALDPTVSADLRPGLNAEVTILIEQIDDQLQLPQQAIYSHGNANYCLTFDGKNWLAHPVQLGASNGKFIVIRDGLSAGHRVVLDSLSHRNQVELPKLPSEENNR